jgi:hypothetical protein
MRADILVHYWSGCALPESIEIEPFDAISCTHGSYSKCPLPSWPREKVSQSNGRRERKSHPVQRLKSAEYFANLGKPGKESSLLATTICTLVSRPRTTITSAVRGSPDPAPPIGRPRSAKCGFRIIKMWLFLEEFDPLRQFPLAGGGGGGMSIGEGPCSNQRRLPGPGDARCGRPIQDRDRGAKR